MTSTRAGTNNGLAPETPVFAIVEVAIGIVFVYLMLAMLVAAANEVIASLLGLRARTLRKAVAGLLGEHGRPHGPRTQAFYGHPLIQALSGRRPPSYIPPATFATVAPEALQRADASAGAPARDTSAVAFAIRHRDTPVRESLESIFQATMDRAVGWYKRTLQVVTLLVSGVLVVLSNADTIRIANTLWTTPTLREAVVEAAQRRVEDQPPPTDPSVLTADYQGDDPIPAADEGSAEELAEGRDRDRLTAAERGLLDALLGWGTDYQAINDEYCLTLQAARDAACAGGIEAPECRPALDRIAAETRCTSEAGRVAGRPVFPGTGVMATTLLPLATGHVLGWVMTMAAITLGAPFWFDLLKGLLNIRGAGRVPKADDRDAAASGTNR